MVVLRAVAVLRVRHAPQDVPSGTDPRVGTGGATAVAAAVAHFCARCLFGCRVGVAGNHGDL
jgi:hypothetical protein